MLYCSYQPSRNIDILLIDSNEIRTSLHRVHQPYRLLVNTGVCQITLFSDDTIKNMETNHKRHNFYNDIIILDVFFYRT